MNDVAPQGGRTGATLLCVLLVMPLLAGLLATLWRVPFGWETIAILEDLEIKPLGELVGLRGAYFRPLFWLSLWTVWDGIAAAGQALIVYKILHAGSIALLMTAFLLALRPRTVTDALVATLAAAVLIGSPAFRENLENLPLNQMILVMLCGTIAWIVVERDHRWWHGPALVAIGLAAIGFKEQGLVVVSLIVAAWLTGAPGIRRSAALVLAAIAVGYVGLRLASPDHWPAFAQSIGVGFTELSPEEGVARYGDVPVRIYAYNVASTAANVLFSEPTRGVFSIARDLAAGRVQPWQLNHLLSSIAVTMVIAAWAIAEVRDPSAGRRERRVVLLLVVAVAGSAALGFNYTRDRFGGVAAVFYAAASYFAVRWIIAVSAGRGRAVMLAGTAVILLIGAAWQMRALGTVHGLRETAWAVRREWIVDLPERRREFAGRPAYLAVLDALSDQGGDPRADTPRDSRRMTRLLGDW